MARRRLNTRVFVIVMGVLVLGGVAVFAANRFRGAHHVDAREAERRGNEAFEKGDFKDAFDHYEQAAKADPKNTVLLLKLGEAAVKRTREDAQFFLTYAHARWGEAVNIDSKYKPALEKLIESKWEQMELYGDTSEHAAKLFTDIRNRSRQLVEAAPENAQAAAWLHRATVQQWIATKSIPQEDLDKSLQQLQEISRRDPANVEAPYYVAKARIQRGLDLIGEKRPDQAATAFGEAADGLKQVLAGQEKNAMLQFRAYELFWRMSRFDPKAAERKHDETAGQCIQAAFAAVKSEPKNYAQITLSYADWLVFKQKEAEARAVRQKLYDEHKDNQLARLAWARTLANKKEERSKAIDVLLQEIPLPADVVGVGVTIHREHQGLTYEALINLYLADLDEETDDVKRASILAKADATLDKLRRLASSRHPKVLGLEGRILLAKDRPVDAVKAFEEAYRQFKTGGKDYMVMYFLAKTYAERTGQPGSARTLCEEIIRENPNGWLAARVMLARLLIGEKKLEAARQQIETIRRVAKDYPELTSLDNMWAYYSSDGDPLRALGIMEKLPETNNRERWVRADFARLAHKPDEQIRLLNDIVTNDPKDVRAVVTLVQLYKARELNERATMIVDRAVVANPDDRTLKLLKSELSGTPAAELRKQIRAQLEESFKEDPFQLQLKLYELERLPGGDPEAAMVALKAASRLRPDDKGVLDSLFKEYLTRRQFPDAKTTLDALVKLNPDQVGGLLYQHRYAATVGNFAEAERLGVQLIEQWPEFAQSWLALAQAQEALGKWPEAITSFNQVLAKQPTNYEALRALVDTYYNAGMTDQAEAKLREMRGLFPNDPIARELLNNHLANFGKPEQAIPEREDQLKKNPKDSWAYLALAATYFKSAQKRAAENKPEDSKKYIDLAFKTLQQGRDQFPDDTRFYAQVAEIHQYNGKVNEAESILKAYADRERDKQAPLKVRPDPWLALADFYLRSGQPENAVSAMSEALVRSEGNLDIRLRLASTQVQARRFNDAVATLDGARNNADPRISRQRLEVLIAQGQLADAEREIRAELKKRDGADLRNLLASVMIDTRRTEDAIAELARAQALDPSNDAARYLRALAFARRPGDLQAQQQNLQLAINELVELKKVQRNPVQTRLLLAELYDKSGKRKLGIQELDDALKKNPGNREIRLALIRLYRAERPPNFAAAQDLVTFAENDPVLKTDPVWPREAAVLYMEQRRVIAAVTKMNQAADMAKGNREYRRELVDMQLRFNDYPGALVQTDRLLREGVNDHWLRTVRGIATGRQVKPAMLAAAKNDPTLAAQVKEIQGQATEEFDEALKLAGNDAEKLIPILKAMGETVGYDAPLARVQPRLANDPNNDWKILALSMKRAKGDFAGAIADGERMRADPANGRDKPERRAPILRALADVYQNQNPPNYVLAKERYQELLQISIDDIVSLNNVAYMLAELVQPSDPHAAREYSQRAFDQTRQTNEPSTLIMDTHGWVLVLCGGSDLAAGKAILHAVVSQNPNLVEGRYHLGEAYLRQETPQLPEAEKELAEAIRLMEEEEKLGATVDTKLKERIQTSLGKVRASLRGS